MKVSTDSRLGRKLAKRDVLIGSSAEGTPPLRRDPEGAADECCGAARRIRGGKRARHRRDRLGDRVSIRLLVDRGPRDQGTRTAAIVHRRGVTAASGLFFLGLPWQHTRGSALIGFVKDDAAFIAGRIESQLEDPAGLVGTDAERT